MIHGNSEAGLVQPPRLIADSVKTLHPPSKGRPEPKHPVAACATAKLACEGEGSAPLLLTGNTKNRKPEAKTMTRGCPILCVPTDLPDIPGLTADAKGGYTKRQTLTTKLLQKSSYDKTSVSNPATATISRKHFSCSRFFSAVMNLSQ